MHQHDWIGARYLGGRFPRGEQRPTLEGLALVLDTLAGNPKMATPDRANGCSGPEWAGAARYVLGHQTLLTVSP